MFYSNLLNFSTLKYNKTMPYMYITIFFVVASKKMIEFDMNIKNAEEN